MICETLPTTENRTGNLVRSLATETHERRA